MAEKTVLECDSRNHGCRGEVQRWHLWVEGDVEAARVDLCPVHARPLTDLAARGQMDSLPSKPRATMEVVKLKPTKATRHLKR